MSYDAATSVSRGTISHLKVALSIPSCHAVVNGTSSSTPDGMVAATYANQTGKLKILPRGGTCTGTTSAAAPACSKTATPPRSAPPSP